MKLAPKYLFCLVSLVPLVFSSCGKGDGPTDSPNSNRAPDAPSAPAGRTLIAVNTAVSLSSVATDPDGDSVSISFSWGDGAQTISARGASGSSLSASHTYTSLGSYRVYARAVDKQGASSDSSTPTRVNIVEPQPTIPSRPAGPDTIFQSQLYTYSTSAVNPVGDSLYIVFDWGDGEKTATGYDSSYAIFTQSHAYYSAGTYTITATSRDAAGQTSGASAPRTPVVFNRSPFPPATPFGQNSAIVDEQLTVYSWAADPDLDLISLEFFWGDGHSTVTPSAKSGAIFSAVHDYDDTGSFQIRAVARDVDGNVSDTSDSFVALIPNYPIIDATIALGAVTPKYMNLRKGYSVRWRNLDLNTHRLTSTEPGGFTSGLIKSLESVVVTFDSSGLFHFYCLTHPSDTGEQGIIAVQ